ncbi:MAG: endolytic transglycosylase MltG [Caldilineaceae bacterium]
MRGTVGNWWWKPQSVEEYAQVISPYNTYLNSGLPPGPIANPGAQRHRRHACNPAATNYCFFLGTGEDGRHVFAQTLAEHEQNLRIYGYR